MNPRERFLSTIKFESVDRYFRWEAPAVWPATIKKWHAEGLPEYITCSNIVDTKVYDYFKMDKLMWLPFEGGWIGDPFYPMFEYIELDDDGKHLLIQDYDGIIKKIKKEDPDTSMPQFIEFPVTDKEDYYQKIKWRLDHRTKERFPVNWPMLIKEYESREYPLGMFIIGPFGHLRNLFGDEGLMYAFFDSPELIHEIMSDWMDFYCGFVRDVSTDVIPDFVMIWEDMCFRSGPLISPELYKEFMSSYLKSVIDQCKKCGITGIIVDNDGDCKKMIPLYLECGANAFYPFEVQAGMDVLDIRKQFGNSFAIIGGIDKRVLSMTRDDVICEVNKIVPQMLSGGGYIPMLDHSVPTNVSLEMFEFFIEYTRKIKD